MLGLITGSTRRHHSLLSLCSTGRVGCERYLHNAKREYHPTLFMRDQRYPEVTVMNWEEMGWSEYERRIFMRK